MKLPVLTERQSSADDLMFTMPALPVSLSAARRRLARWLDALEWPDDDADDVLLAVNEALANVVDHAYPPYTAGTASVHAWAATDLTTMRRHLVITVIDRGRWAAYHPESPAPILRGRGLAMMRACMHELHLQPSAAGTTVIMVSVAVPVGCAQAATPA